MERVVEYFKTNKSAQLVGLIIGVVILIAIVTAFIVRASKDATNSQPVVNSTVENGTNSTTLERRRIDGIEVPSNESNLMPIAVMVENLASIRPQAGLGQANLVYEALAEGGITRFMAVFASHDVVDKIGPVRSARPYFVDLAEEYRGIYAHVGGSPQALGILNSNEYITDLNQFGYSHYFYRDATLQTAFEHTLFTSSQLLALALRDLNLADQTGEYTVYQFKLNPEKKDRPESTTPIKINFSSKDYAVEWRYDRDSNSYLRWNGGKLHSDANTNEQLKAKNIIVQFVRNELLDGISGRLNITTIGQGDGVVFQDGIATTIHWNKSARGERTIFSNSTTQEQIQFNPGSTWIELVPESSSENIVTY